MHRFDALIIGGGPAGSTAALLLAQAGWSVAVVEAKQFPRRKVCGEYLSATNWPLLTRLGLAEAFSDLAGPPVRRTAVFAGKQAAYADLPRPAQDAGLWGRSLAREHLDTLLLENAARVGAAVLQPSRCTHMVRGEDGFVCRVESRDDGREVHARIVIAAHGSWEIGELSTQRQPSASRPGDWLAFKAHFRATNLPSDLMPLLSFPDGYGGIVHCDSGRTSLSCCIRRRRLERIQRGNGQSAGEAVLQHILDATPILRPILDDAVLDGPWLSAGPIQPGMRHSYQDGVFVIGNAAGEAHPVVAEGISMAMQSAWLLAERLIAHRAGLQVPAASEAVARAYAASWRHSFAPRIRAAAAIAHWASRPKLVAATLPLLRAFPAVLTLGARMSGKVRMVKV